MHAARPAGPAVGASARPMHPCGGVEGGRVAYFVCTRPACRHAQVQMQVSDKGIQRAMHRSTQKTNPRQILTLLHSARWRVWWPPAPAAHTVP